MRRILALLSFLFFATVQIGAVSAAESGASCDRTAATTAAEALVQQALADVNAADPQTATIVAASLQNGPEQPSSFNPNSCLCFEECMLECGRSGGSNCNAFCSFQCPFPPC